MIGLYQVQAFAAATPKAPPRIDHLDLIEFAERSWTNVLQPGIPWIRSRAVEAMAVHLTALLKHECATYLWINIGPGHLKSWLLNVMFPAYAWTIAPEETILCAARNQGLANRDADAMLNLVQSPWYATVSPSGARLRKAATTFFRNHAGGHRGTVTVNGSTGWRARLLILDDPMTREQAYSSTYCESVYQWMKGDWLQRMNTGGRMVAVMQGLSDQDACSRWLADYPTQTDMLALQEERCRIVVPDIPRTAPEWRHTRGESDTALTRAGTWQDTREEGELLCEAVFSRERAEMEKRDRFNWQAQRQQSPLPREEGQRMLYGFTEACVGRFLDKWLDIEPRLRMAASIRDGWRFWAGFDHGIGARREVAIIGAYHDREQEIWAVADYRNATRTTPKQDAIGVRARMDRLSIPTRLVTYAYGDVGNTGKSDDTPQTINTALTQARFEDGSPILGFPIHVPDKGTGSVETGCERLNVGFLSGALFIDDGCNDLLQSVKGWTGGAEHKDLCDALRYPVRVLLERWDGQRKRTPQI